MIKPHLPSARAIRINARYTLLFFTILLSYSCPLVFAFSTEMSFIDKLALVLIRNRRQLVARSVGKTAFFTPGGKREAGESDQEALCRECQEELTIELKKETIQPYGVFQAQAFGKPPGTMVRMTCYTAEYAGTLAPSEEVEELAWIKSDFSPDKLTVTGQMILADLKEKDLID